MKRPVIIGAHNAKSSDPDDAMEPYTLNGAGERLWKMVNDVYPCDKDKYFKSFEFINVLDQDDWKYNDPIVGAGKIRFRLNGRRCFVLGREAWEALRFGKHAKFFTKERSFTGSTYILLPHPSGKNLVYNSDKVRNKVGTLLARVIQNASIK